MKILIIMIALLSASCGPKAKEQDSGGGLIVFALFVGIVIMISIIVRKLGDRKRRLNEPKPTEERALDELISKLKKRDPREWWPEDELFGNRTYKRHSLSIKIEKGKIITVSQDHTLYVPDSGIIYELTLKDGKNSILLASGVKIRDLFDTIYPEVKKYKKSECEIKLEQEYLEEEEKKKKKEKLRQDSIDYLKKIL